MANERWGVMKVKGLEPEVFLIFWLNLELPRGNFMKTSDCLPESDLRAELKKMGCGEAEINSLFQKARANPV